MVYHHRISSPCECRRMIRPKPLEVTRIFLSTYYTTLCDSSCCNTYSLSKSLLIKHWWCLTSTSWTPSTSSSLLAIYTINMTVKSNAVSLRHKHSLETLFIHINQCIHIVLAFTGNARHSIIHLKHFYQQKFHFLKILFFRKF